METEYSWLMRFVHMPISLVCLFVSVVGLIVRPDLEGTIFSYIFFFSVGVITGLFGFGFLKPNRFSNFSVWMVVSSFFMILLLLLASLSQIFKDAQEGAFVLFGPLLIGILLWLGSLLIGFVTALSQKFSKK